MVYKDAFIFHLLLATTLLQGLSCLKLLLLDVPQYKFSGDTVLLQCVFDLQSDRLYSVTWYKDHEEFYRFVPKANLPQHSYQLDGVDVDHHSSDSQKVLLRNVSLKTSGLYRCEVSAEAPSFTSVHGEGRMEVVSLPEENPEIIGEERLYQVGDVISLNCTSDSSFPPAVIRWYINDEPVSPDFETEVESSEGLYSSISRLQFKVEPKHFVDGRMKVRCVSTVSTETDNVLEHSVEPLIDNREALLLVFTDGDPLLPAPRPRHLGESSQQDSISLPSNIATRQRGRQTDIRGGGALHTAYGLLTLLMTSLVTWFNA